MKSNNILKSLEDVARKAGDEVMKIYRTNFEVFGKEDKTFVTEADIRANKVITQELKIFNWPILSEESKDNVSRLNAKKIWVVDPLDGTRDFVKRTGEFCVMIGLVEEGSPVMGVVYLPVLDKMYIAKKGEGAFLIEMGTKHHIRASKKREFKNAEMVIGRNRFGKRAKMIYDNLEIGNIKSAGSNGLKMGLISEAKADVFYNPTDKMGEWDLCAPQIILEEAGGKVTNSFGEKIIYNKEKPSTPAGVLATNGKLHTKIVKEIENRDVSEKCPL